MAFARTSAAVVLLALASPALAQFGTPASTPIAERLAGKLLSAEGAPTVAAGDQLGAFFNNQLVGLATFASTDNAFSFKIYGDVASTTAVEGPREGQAVTFRFYDASTNSTRTDLRVENLEGEPFSYRYAGTEGAPVGLPIDLTPTRTLNIKIGATSTGGGGNGGGTPTNKYDVDASGKVDTADAAMVLRIVTGGARGVSDETRARADVTGDRKVDTADAIEIMRNR